MLKWHKFVALPPADRLLFVRALLSLAWARVELAVLPFALLRTRPRIAPKQGADPERIAWATRAASRFVPGATCLVMAFAAQRLLAANGHPSNVRIGVSRCRAATVRERCPTPPAPGPRPPAPDLPPAPDTFQAHAWLEHDGAILIGASDAAYVPLTQWSVAP